MILRVQEFIIDLTEESIKVNGIGIKCMDMENLHGAMDAIMKATIRMTRNMVKIYCILG